MMQALLGVGLSEHVVGQIRAKFPAPAPVEKKKERSLADLGDKRDMLQRQLDKLVEDADRKRRLYEEAARKVSAQSVGG